MTFGMIYKVNDIEKMLEATQCNPLGCTGENFQINWEDNTRTEGMLTIKGVVYRLELKEVR